MLPTAASHFGPGAELWMGNLRRADRRCGAGPLQFVGALQESAVAFGGEIERLRGGGKANDDAVEVGSSLRVEPPITSADAEAEMRGRLVRERRLQLDAGAMSILGDRAG